MSTAVVSVHPNELPPSYPQGAHRWETMDPRRLRQPEVAGVEAAPKKYLAGDPKMTLLGTVWTSCYLQMPPAA